MKKPPLNILALGEVKLTKCFGDRDLFINNPGYLLPFGFRVNLKNISSGHNLLSYVISDSPHVR